MFPEPPLLSLEGVSKTFPGVRALTDVDLAVGAGEIVSLVGQNGAGKSTLMSIIGGIYLPDTGTVSVAGSVVRSRRCKSVTFDPCRRQYTIALASGAIDAA